jgi:copper homeostasis protein CutC
MEITFHKAFDQVKDIVKSYVTLSDLRINRILTQGGTQSIIHNTEKLA